MDTSEFENQLILIRQKLNESIKNGEIKDLDVYIKLVLDHQELLAKSLFNKMDEIDHRMTKDKGDIEKNIRQKHEQLMKEIHKN